MVNDYFIIEDSYEENKDGNIKIKCRQEEEFG